MGEGVGVDEELIGGIEEGGVLDGGSEFQRPSLDFLLVGTFPGDLQKLVHFLVDDLL